MAELMSRMSEVTAARREHLDTAKTGHRMATHAATHGRHGARVKDVPLSGASPDYHISRGPSRHKMQEMAWELYRNNMVIGAMTDQAVNQTLPTAIGRSANTGDEKADADVDAWWKEVSSDPKECDPGWQLTFDEQAVLTLRSWFVAGAMFSVPLREGQVELREPYLCRSPSDARTREANSRRNAIIDGVEYETGSGRVKRYYFLPGDRDPLSRANINLNDLTPIDAWRDGEQNCWHFARRTRASQTHGVSAYNPLFDATTYHDDIQFLALVNARAQSLVTFIENRETGFKDEFLQAEADAEEPAEKQVADNARQYREMESGAWLKSLPGAEIKPWASNTPGMQHFPHMRMLQTFMAINLGLPHIMAMMDASQGSFSSIRGAVDMARVGFKKNQQAIIRGFHTPYFRWKLRHHALRQGQPNRALRNLIERSSNPRSKIDVFRGRWDCPAWSSVDPLKDAAANTMRSANSQVSPTRLSNESGTDWGEESVQIVKDRSEHLERAIVRAQQLIDKHNLNIDPLSLAREIAPQPQAENVTLSITTNADGDATNQPEGAAA